MGVASSLLGIDLKNLVIENVRAIAVNFNIDSIEIPNNCDLNKWKRLKQFRNDLPSTEDEDEEGDNDNKQIKPLIADYIDDKFIREGKLNNEKIRLEFKVLNLNINDVYKLVLTQSKKLIIYPKTKQLFDTLKKVNNFGSYFNEFEAELNKRAIIIRNTTVEELDKHQDQLKINNIEKIETLKTSSKGNDSFIVKAVCKSNKDVTRLVRNGLHIDCFKYKVEKFEIVNPLKRLFRSTCIGRFLINKKWCYSRSVQKMKKKESKRFHKELRDIKRNFNQIQMKLDKIEGLNQRLTSTELSLNEIRNQLNNNNSSSSSSLTVIDTKNILLSDNEINK
jgi:ribosomal protein S10